MTVIKVPKIDGAKVMEFVVYPNGDLQKLTVETDQDSFTIHDDVKLASTFVEITVKKVSKSPMGNDAL